MSTRNHVWIHLSDKYKDKTGNGIFADGMAELDKVFFPDRDQLPGLGKLHHKTIVIDDAIVITGSMNYTPPANEYNDENIVVLGSPFKLPKSKGGLINKNECKAIAQFFRKEITRIINKSTLYTQ